MALYYLRKIMVLCLYNIILFQQRKLSSIFSPLSSVWLHHHQQFPADGEKWQKVEGEWMLGGGVGLEGGDFLFTFRFLV